MRWNEGRDQIEASLQRGTLSRVPPSRPHAERLLTEARRHLASARLSAETDPSGAYTLMYDGARKALAALLANQGLRTGSSSGHVELYETVRAQLGNSAHMVRPFDRMRRARNQAEYPSSDTPELTTDDVLEDLPKAQEILDLVQPLLDQMGPF